MNRRLILMRHAKSSWKRGPSDDHERPLNERGRRSARLVGARLSERGWIPELVCSSDSVRTRETWKHLRAAFGDAHIDVRFTPELYLAGMPELRRLSKSFDPAIETVLALGHNPGFELALAELSGEAERMTTANAALLSGTGESWAASLRGPWSLMELIRPRELESRFRDATGES